MSGVLRIGFVGAGANTRWRHIPGFRALPGVELAAVVNRTRASSEAAAREAGIVRVAEHWSELVESDAIDAICIGTWPHLHAEITLAALRAGKHVLTEARMAATLAEAEAMRDALAEAKARKAGVVAQIVPSPMTVPWDAMIGDLLAAGTLGKITEVRIAHLHGGYADPEHRSRGGNAANSTA
jgi:predicted dehydrogenase